MTKKILLVGSFSQRSDIYMYADSFLRSLVNMGFVVKPFNYRQQLVPFGRINNMLINYKLLLYARKYKPDFIFIVKGELIHPKILKRIKQEVGSLIITFYPDNPFTLWNGNSNYHVLQALPLHDYFLSWSQDLMPILKTAGCKHTSFFPFGVDHTIFTHTPTQTYINRLDVCFIGTWEPDREKWFSQLLEKMPNLKLGIWGNGWHEHTSCILVREKIIGRAIYTHEMMTVFRRSKIVLNLLRTQNSMSHNMRSIEIPAAGGFQLSERSPELITRLFTEDESIACFSTLDELCKKIDFYLNNDQARTDIARKGMLRARQFSLDNQLKAFFQEHNLLPR